jgi:hypothetical protein
MTYIQNQIRQTSEAMRASDVLTFADWLKFSLIEELTYKIDVWFKKKSDQLDMICSPAF